MVITNLKHTKTMTTMTKNGVSTTTNRGQEQYEPFRYFNRTKRQMITLYQYDYRFAWGELFSCVGRSLKQCRKLRDEHAMRYVNSNNF